MGTMYKLCDEQRNGTTYQVCQVLENLPDGYTLVRDIEGVEWIVGVSDPFYTPRHGHGDIFDPREAQIAE